MKILIVLSLLFTGCAHSPFMEPPKTAYLAPLPCGPDDCGKPIKWETL